MVLLNRIWKQNQWDFVLKRLYLFDLKDEGLVARAGIEPATQGL